MGIDTWDLVDQARESGGSAPEEYADFLIRFVAYLIDSVAICVFSVIIFFTFIFIGALLAELTGGSESSGPAGSSVASTVACCFICMAYGGGIVASWLYNAGFESSALMGTPGKLLMGIKVTDLAGNRISFSKATLRFICKAIFSLFFLIGYIYILISDKKQGLYDVFAGTLVVKRD